MREKGLRHRRSNYSLLMPAQLPPELIATCPRCGGEIGLWSQEPETVCLFCDQKIFERESTVH